MPNTPSYSNNNNPASFAVFHRVPPLSTRERSDTSTTTDNRNWAANQQASADDATSGFSHDAARDLAKVRRKPNKKSIKRKEAKQEEEEDTLHLKKKSL